jgi:hypothetical protein
LVSQDLTESIRSKTGREAAYSVIWLAVDERIGDLLTTDDTHSSLSTCMGSTTTARKAGIVLAATAMIVKPPAASASVGVMGRAVPSRTSVRCLTSTQKSFKPVDVWGRHGIEPVDE